MGERPLALITGGARRVGRTTSLALARGGCDLIVTYRSSRGGARALIDEVRGFGANVAAERLDLGDLVEVRAFAAAIARSHRRLDVLVHNASIYAPTPLDAAAREAGEGEFGVEDFMRVNAVAPLVLTAGLAGSLRNSILPIGAGVVAMCDIHSMGRPRKDHAAYSMSKAALEEMVRSLARDLAPRVRVNGVAPGVVAWPEHGDEADEALQRRYLERVPLERAGTPEDAAEVVRWLALDAAYTTGQIVRVDGGRWLV
ncbi:MAG: SDR family oxidoreductase [Phycisphaeraceae bacterium]|nr:SDR family oxidoreductase [Phycisphaeraceae bacterium]